MISEKIIERLKKDNEPFNADDNISSYIKLNEFELLEDEVTEKFDAVLRSLIIDVDNDPNSHETSRRLAQMYIYEIMSGRYLPAPSVKAFPNDGAKKYHGMLVVRSDIISVCSHHHQPVNGVCFIGIIPKDEVIGLSKYTRIAQWCARRGTLQESLCESISDHIKQVSHSDDVGVYISARHGCCENRGINSTDSTTQTTVLSGQFHDLVVKEEFLKYIELQKR